MVKNIQMLSFLIIFDEGSIDPFFDGENGQKPTVMSGYRITAYRAAGKVIGARSERRGTRGRPGPGGHGAQNWNEGTPPARLMGRMHSSRLSG
jgi:hypothetical protein